jgi:uncharacterized protein YqeY
LQQIVLETGRNLWSAGHIEVIQAYLPQQLTEDEIKAIVAEAAASVGATSMADMGKLMGALKPKVQGRADMGVVGAMVKAQLNS